MTPLLGMASRPRVKPAIGVAARDEETLQFGLHPARAVLLTGLDERARRFVAALDGTRTLAQAVAGSGLDETTATRIIELLAGRGLLDDVSGPAPLTSLSREERDRFRPDLEALSLPPTVYELPADQTAPPAALDGGLRAFTARQGSYVRIYGGGRIGARVAALLAAAGVGRICVLDPEPARPEDVVPGGLGWEHVGRPREEGAVKVASTVAPSVTAWEGRAAAGLMDGAATPDMVVLAPVGAADPLLAHDLTTLGIPHLLATCAEGCGSVGPVVVPGRSPCLGCIELTRRDRDPGWPTVRAAIRAQTGCDTVTSGLVAGQAAGHVLAFLDGRGVDAIGTAEILPDLQWRRRVWPRHPRCRCSRNDQAGLTMVA
ncbi:ThiF family adenylyltransferase [Herbidospora cretacea]|uniref:ThiF family adenylyltransferase n=1 Tax=Herbidospora cretacea TaxID=28444 RepID=UPI000A4821B7|nr:ThiF family adenylyltransferase [Herbidospora cretacea]